MINNSNDNLFLKLKKLLSGRQLEASAIHNALKLICDSFSFSCGMIYEADVTNRLLLIEHFTAGTSPVRPSISAHELTEQMQAFLADQDIHYIAKALPLVPPGQLFLDLFSAESIILSQITDENGGIYGLVVFGNTSSSTVLTDDEMNLLTSLLSILACNVSVRMFQRKLKLTQGTLENILNNTGIDIYVNDFYTHEILYVNTSMAAPYGGQQQFMDRKCWQVLFPGQTQPCDFCPQNKLIDASGKPTAVYSWDYQRPFDGSWFRVFSSAFYWTDGRLAHIVSSADITENKHNEALIEYMANFDQLTKLPNRRMLINECKHCIDNATPEEQGYLLFFDIDNFKHINDELGHDAGDEFLIQLGEFFSGIPLLKNSIYRNGGDEFVAIIGGEGITKDNIRNLANFIHQRFTNPWVLKQGAVTCNTSIGVACYPEDGVTAEALLQKADAAMYHIKKSGGGGLCFGYQLDQGIS